ncbi:6-carboxytetrahydropterin synthase QueD [Lactococcus petauri]
MSIKAVRKMKFDAGHRVVNHESKCANAHGHEYHVEAFAESDSLDEIGRVIDFSVIKEKLGKWLDEHWDHTFLVYEKDDLLMPIKEKLTVNKPVYVCKFNPTAENMATHLLKEICPVLFKNTGVKITKIVIHETSNCYVSAEE